MTGKNDDLLENSAIVGGAHNLCTGGHSEDTCKQQERHGIRMAIVLRSVCHA